MLESLSSRRAWIEIIEYEKDNSTGTVALLTESVDRNCFKQDVANKLILSLSSRRAWIEITIMFPVLSVWPVALLS